SGLGQSERAAGVDGSAGATSCRASAVPGDREHGAYGLGARAASAGRVGDAAASLRRGGRASGSSRLHSAFRGAHVLGALRAARTRRGDLRLLGRGRDPSPEPVGSEPRSRHLAADRARPGSLRRASHSGGSAAGSAGPDGATSGGACRLGSRPTTARSVRSLGGGGTMSAPKPRVDLDVTRDRLQRLGLMHAAEQLGERITASVKETTSPHRFLDELLDAELGVREERRIRTTLRLSGLPLGQTLANFDFSFQPSVDRSRIETLATCAWIREGFTLLLQGPPGVGKTHLAVALGVRAVQNGFSVAFFRLEELLLALKRDADLPPSRLRRRKYNNVALVIVDEV